MLAPILSSGSFVVILSALSLTAANPFVLRSPIAKGSLFLRQTAPTPCDSQCAVFENAINTCTTPSCFCTNAVSSSLQSCVNCAVNAAPTAEVFDSVEQLVDSYLAVCPSASIVTPNAPQSPSGSASAPANTPTAPIASPSGSGSTPKAPTSIVPNSNTATGTGAGSNSGFSSATQTGDPLAGLPSITSLVTSTIRPDDLSTSPQSQPTGGSAGLSSAGSHIQSLTFIPLGLIAVTTWMIVL